jgi:transglutaminase/protease-like cytokinesis protein 3
VYIIYVQSYICIHVKVSRKLFYDKGKPSETVGRKAIGPYPEGYGSRATEGRVFFMLRILISFVLCLILAMSPMVGQQLEQLQADPSADFSAVDVDKPEYTYQESDIANGYHDNKGSINTTGRGNVSTEAEAISKVSVNSAAASSEAAEPNGESIKPLVTETSQVLANYSEPVSSKPTQVETKESDAKVDKAVDALAGQSQAESAKPAEAFSEQSNIKAGKSVEVSEEHNDPVPAGSGTVAAEQAAPAKEAAAPKNAVAVSQAPAAVADGKAIDTSMVNSGLIGVRYLNQSGKKMKLMVEKDGTRYTYNLKGDNSLETFPLQSGNGNYKVSIMENTEGNRYRYLLTESVSVKADNANAAYLNSIQMINWNRDMAAIKKAAEITSGVSQEEEKVKVIYNYIVSNIRYDTSKLNNLPSTYLPVIDETLQSKLGICYDFASLNAAMLRSAGIPTKLVMGYAEGVNGYHAWNEVYMGGKWVTIDISYDSQMREAGKPYSMNKDRSKYQSEKEY